MGISTGLLTEGEPVEDVYLLQHYCNSGCLWKHSNDVKLDLLGLRKISNGTNDATQQHQT